MDYDLVVVGGGGAGVTAAIYAKRYRMNVMLISESIGGTIAEAHRVENYPSYKSISGIDLGKKFEEQLNYLEVPIVYDEVKRIEKIGKGFKVWTSDKNYTTYSLVLALGTKRRKLNLPNERDYLGKGVSYCSTCDGPFFKNKIVGVVGGSDGAASAAILLAQHADKVYMVYRGEKLRAEPAWVEEIEANKKIEVVLDSNVVELQGKGKLENVKLDTGKKIKLDGLFIEIGGVPASVTAQELGVELDNGYIKTDILGKTNIQGVFAAGDCTTITELKQLIVACAQGAGAAYSSFRYIRGIKNEKPI